MSDYKENGDYGIGIFNSLWALILYGLKSLIVSAFILGVFNALSPIFDHSGWNILICILSSILSILLLLIFIFIAYKIWEYRKESNGISSEEKELLFNLGISSICLTILLILNFTDPIMSLRIFLLVLLSKFLLALGCYIGMIKMLLSDTFKVKLHW